MAKNIVSLDRLADVISEELTSYNERVVVKINDALKSSANTIKKTIKSTAPRSGDKQSNGFKPLADSFTVKEEKNIDGNNYIICSPKKYRIIHLLENGFYHVRGKKNIQGKPFMRPAFEKEKPQLENEIIKIVKGGE